MKAVALLVFVAAFARAQDGLCDCKAFVEVEDFPVNVAVGPLYDLPVSGDNSALPCSDLGTINCRQRCLQAVQSFEANNKLTDTPPGSSETIGATMCSTAFRLRGPEFEGVNQQFIQSWYRINATGCGDYDYAASGSELRLCCGPRGEFFQCANATAIPARHF